MFGGSHESDFHNLYLLCSVTTSSQYYVNCVTLDYVLFPFCIILLMLTSHSPHAFSSTLLLFISKSLLHYYFTSLSLPTITHKLESSHIPLILSSHSSFVFLCISPNCSSSLSNTSHGIIMKRLSSKSLTNHTLFCPHALDNVMYALNGVRCPLNGVPMSTHKCSIVWP